MSTPIQNKAPKGAQIAAAVSFGSSFFIALYCFFMGKGLIGAAAFFVLQAIAIILVIKPWPEGNDV